MDCFQDNPFGASTHITVMWKLAVIKVANGGALITSTPGTKQTNLLGMLIHTWKAMGPNRKLRLRRLHLRGLAAHARWPDTRALCAGSAPRKCRIHAVFGIDEISRCR